MDGFIERRIKDIKGEKRVAVSGVVVDKAGESFMIDDGSGSLAVVGGCEFKEGDYVRVFGIMLNEGELQAEVVQDLNKIDKREHQKILDKIS